MTERTMQLIRSAARTLSPAMVKTFSKAVAKGVDKDRKWCVANQHAMLAYLVAQGTRTEWGRKHGFETLAGSDDLISDFQSAVPLATYEAFREYIDRMRAGETNVLWPGCTKYYAVSSGTVSQGKLIPASGEMLQQFRKGSMRVLANYVRASGRDGLLTGHMIGLPGSHDEDTHHPGVYMGEMSSLVTRVAPRFISSYWQAVRPDTLLEAEWDRKMRNIVSRIAHMDITTIAMAPTWAIRLLPDVIREFNRQNGTRATSIRAVWPNLSVFFSSGVALSSYKDALSLLIGDDEMDFIELYTASEGFFAYQDRIGAEDMLLASDRGVFYEFVRFRDLHAPSPRRYTIQDVDIGVKYAMYVTTCSGLFAYGMRDVVTFTSKDPYRLVVSGRTSEMLDKYGEAVFVDEIEQAMRYSCARTGSDFRNFHVAPTAMTNGTIPHHQYFVEFLHHPNDKALFEQTVDDYLMKINRHYKIRREARTMRAPELIALPGGAFDRWLAEAKKRVSAQSKVPRISETRTVAEALIRDQ